MSDEIETNIPDEEYVDYEAVSREALRATLRVTATSKLLALAYATAEYEEAAQALIDGFAFALQGDAHRAASIIDEELMSEIDRRFPVPP